MTEVSTTADRIRTLRANTVIVVLERGSDWPWTAEDEDRICFKLDQPQIFRSSQTPNKLILLCASGSVTRAMLVNAVGNDEFIFQTIAWPSCN